ncbi:hypothetical protein BH10CYA1_BH10CYA1_28650 [soil metagenome]
MKQITFLNGGTAATSAFAALLAGMTVNNPNHGDIVDGEVVAATKNGFYVSIGTKSDAFISADECTDDLKVGDKSRFLVTKKTESDEEFTLSQKRVASTEQRNAAWTKIASLHQSKSTTRALLTKLTHTRSNDHFSGAEATIDGVTCFIPRRELVFFGDPSKLVNTEIPVKVTKFDREANRHGEVILSHSKAVQEQQRDFLASLKRGTVVKGTVARILAEDKGVLIDLGETTGLLPRTELSQNRSARTADLVTVGEELDLEVIRIDLVKGTVHLSRTAAAFKALKCGEVVNGVVVSVATYGVFVTINGCVDGLLHESELDGADKADFKQGAAVVVRIKNVDAKACRISLTRVGVPAQS